MTSLGRQDGLSGDDAESLAMADKHVGVGARHHDRQRSVAVSFDDEEPCGRVDARAAYLRDDAVDGHVNQVRLMVVADERAQLLMAAQCRSSGASRRALRMEHSCPGLGISAVDRMAVGSMDTHDLTEENGVVVMLHRLEVGAA